MHACIDERTRAPPVVVYRCMHVVLTDRIEGKRTYGGRDRALALGIY
jgi:hypothetical protein